MRVQFSVVLFFTWMASQAGDIRYPASAIPEKLLKNAHIVKRMESKQFELFSTRNSKLHYKYAYTILNENGQKYAGFQEYYDKFRHIESIEGSLYDKDGKLVKKVKGREMRDVSAVDNISLLSDDRVKHHNFYWRSYPYTVEYEVELSFDQTFNFPDWLPQEHRNLSVEQSQLLVTVPSDYVLRYKMLNYKSQPLQTNEKNKKQYTWQVSGLEAMESEYFSLRWQELVPMVSLAPSQFEWEEYKGNMDSWQGFGEFVYTLNKGRDVLPEEVKRKVHEVIAKATNEREKVELLYHFLQQNTRYINISLGIGGWQPFDAMYVYKNGYGDCKALSNYMYSLLKEAGIRSHYTLIRAGDFDHYMMDDFPSPQFNHAILCVPLQKDTMWLECTSQSQSAGYMGEFTGNRKALLITEKGGLVVSTPRYGLSENLEKRVITATLGPEGTLNMNVATKYAGVQQDDLSGRVDNLSKDLVKKYLEEELELATYEVNDFTYSKRTGIIPEIEEHLNVSVSNYATISGKRIFIVPNILDKGGIKMDEERRLFDYVFEHSFHNECETEIEIPDGYEVEAMLPDVSLKTKYGTYYSAVKVFGNKILHKRIREQFSGRFPASEQKEIMQFFTDIYKADRRRMVLVKKGQ